MLYHVDAFFFAFIGVRFFPFHLFKGFTPSIDFGKLHLLAFQDNQLGLCTNNSHSFDIHITLLYVTLK